MERLFVLSNDSELASLKHQTTGFLLQESHQSNQVVFKNVNKIQRAILLVNDPQSHVTLFWIFIPDSGIQNK